MYAVGPDGPGIWFFSLDAARIILNHVRTLEFEERVRQAMRVDFPSPDFLAHHSPGVDTGIGRPRFVANEARQQEIA